MQYKRSNRIVSSLLENQIPDSISTTPYMIKKHREIRKRFNHTARSKKDYLTVLFVIQQQIKVFMEKEI